MSVEPTNAALQARVAEVAAMRERGAATVPTTMALEKVRARAAGRPQRHARAHRAHVHAVLTPLHSLAPRQATNPFLRPDSPALQECIGMAGRPLGEVWAETRKRKDNF